MAKPGDFYVSVLDFFGALVPGAFAVGAAKGLGLLRIASGTTVDPLIEFVVLAYVVGHVLNGLGSFVLDWVYDLLYAPGKGFLSRPSLKKPKRTAPEGAPPPRPFYVPGLNIVERGARRRGRAAKEELDVVTKRERPTRGIYQRVRAYLRVAAPEAFAEVERLEAEQKFFRTMAVACAVLAIAHLSVGPINWRLTIGLVGLVVFLFVRYVALRRKTVDRAYMYLDVRACFPAVAERAAPHAGKAE